MQSLSLLSNGDTATEHHLADAWRPPLLPRILERMGGLKRMVADSNLFVAE